MSYSIEYNRQFIKTENGYTPCWLVGDNNVTEGFGRNERRVRNWSVFMNLLDVTEDELVEKAKELFNSYDQHWKRGSTWVSNKGLISWVKSGCRKAATVEDILSVNPYMGRIHCYLVYYDEKDCRQVILDVYLATTLAFTDWVQQVKAFKSENFYKHVYPIIDFGTEKLVHPKVQEENMEEDKQIVIKTNKGYIAEISERTLSYTQNIKEAKVLKYNEFKNLRQQLKESHSPFLKYLETATLVDANKQSEDIYVLKFVDGTYAGKYLGKKVRGKINLAYSANGANVFIGRKAAEKALQNLKSSLSLYGNIEIEKL